ncbi:MAG: HDIG domain-containing protein [Flavobacteriales bacterium]|nr:HDIG domain-containing protein [Flavobacteriales bacterium]
MSSFFNHIRDRHQGILTLALFGFCALVIVYFFPREGRFKYEFEAGNTWRHDDLDAPFSFAIRKSDQELDSTRAGIQQHFVPIYVMDEKVEVIQIRKFRQRLNNQWNQSGPGNESGGLRGLLTSDKRDSLNLLRHEELGIEILKHVFGKGVVSLDQQHEHRTAADYIQVVRNNVVHEELLDDLLMLKSADSYVQQAVNEADRVDKAFLTWILQDALDYNVFYDAGKSHLQLEEELRQIPAQKGKINVGESIIRRGEMVTPERYQVLQSLKMAYEKRTGGFEHYWFVVAGQVILVSVCLVALAIFLKLLYPQILREPSRVLFVLALLVLMVLIAKFALRVEVLHIYLAPLCMLPMIVRAFYDVKLALFLHLVAVFIISFIVPNPFEFVFLQIFAGILLMYGLSNMRTRSQFFNSAFLIFGSYAVTYFGLNLLQEGRIEAVDWNYYAWFGGNAMLSLFAFPLIYVFEKSFGFLSEVSLVEIADSNNPLLRELNQKAPGTFQHTLQVANLAEEAILAIGGDALLVRAGAMYHDIGKMVRPEMFIENQHTSENPHDELTYEESAHVIIQHVIQGIEIARKAGLPEQIIDFIRTHHGTTRTEYFYRKAIEDFGASNVDESKYTYPGPKPFSRESAVLMMADSVEAASKSLREPEAESLGYLVDSIIERQMSRGQFDNADITLGEITQIKKLLKKRLMSIYHVRVSYPED